MKESVYRKLETLVERYEEVQALLSDPDVISDQDRFRSLSKEYSELEDVTKAFNAYRQAEDDVATAEEMLKDNEKARAFYGALNEILESRISDENSEPLHSISLMALL